MFGSRQLSDGRRSEKSNFVQTCNLLSRYMKEKGSLRDLNLEIGGKIESLEAIASTTMDVTSDKGKSARQSNEQHPSMAIDSSINTVEDTSLMLTSKEVAGQLTILYSGRVLVFDECPADKAKEVIAFAKKQSSLHMSYGILSSSGREGLPQASQKAVGIPSNRVTPQPADLPIARRSSVHRFLEKRKDRAAVRGPYHDQVQEQPASSGKGDEQLELRL